MDTHRWITKAALALFCSALLVATAAPAGATVVTSFTQRFTAQTRGDIALVGNTVVSCPSALPGCADARSGKDRVNNNDWPMAHLDSDADPATFNSSSAELELPPGARVLYAAISWSGLRGSGGCAIDAVAVPCSAPPTDTDAAAARVKLKGPDAAAYTQVEADFYSVSNNIFTGYTDVTALVRTQGAGTWSAADIQTGTGANVHGGWGLVVAYGTDTGPVRNLTVTHGHALVDDKNLVVADTVSGFSTPATGEFDTVVGVIAYEGDRGYAGDSLSLKGAALSDAQHPATNFFRSGDTRLAELSAQRTPSYPNLMGTDVSTIDIGELLGNAATSASLTFSTAGETYVPSVLTFATDTVSVPPTPPTTPTTTPTSVPPTTTPPSSAAPRPTTPKGSLARTGATHAPLLVAGATLVALGALTLGLSRRRRG